MSKQLRFTKEIGINYITHIYTLANAGFYDSKYEEMYLNSVTQEDLDVVRKNVSLIQFSQGVNGEFALMFYFIPALNNLNSIEHWKNYFIAWDKYILEHNDILIKKYFAGYHDKNLYKKYHNTDKSLWINSIRKIGDVFTKYFQCYQDNIWLKIEPILRQRCLELNKYIPDIQYIKKWQESTGYTYNYDNYVTTLFYAGKNGPSWNNVSLNKNTTYYLHDEDFMLDMISHELGVHVMIPNLWSEFNKLKADGIPHKTVYYAFEMLATYYNSKVLGRLGNDIYNDECKKFVNIYSILGKNDNLTPKEMLKEGLSYYLEK